MIGTRSGADTVQVTLEPSSYTKEKFDLYCSYQHEIHNDDDKSESGFKRFLVNSPLIVSRLFGVTVRSGSLLISHNR